MKYKKGLYWMELSDDGLLKEIKTGAWYSQSDINPYNGFDTEENALTELHRLKEIYKHDIPNNVVLISKYTLVYSD